MDELRGRSGNDTSLAARVMTYCSVKAIMIYYLERAAMTSSLEPLDQTSSLAGLVMIRCSVLLGLTVWMAGLAMTCLMAAIWTARGTPSSLLWVMTKTV